jgi:hypothetical protein
MGNQSTTPDEPESESLLAEEDEERSLAEKAGDTLSSLSSGLAAVAGIERIKRPEEMTWTEQLEAEAGAMCDLTIQQRLKGFVICAALGFLLSFGSFLRFTKVRVRPPDPTGSPYHDVVCSLWRRRWAATLCLSQCVTAWAT